MRPPPGWSAGMVALRALLFVLPVAALLVALPQVPNWAVVVLVVVAAGQWAVSPDHVAGTTVVVLVGGWWSLQGVLDWRVPVVGVLLVTAHVLATVLAHGPGTLRVEPALARLWARRAAVSLLPLALTYAAVRGLDAGLAPPGLWLLAALVLLAVTVAATRITRVEAE